MLARIQEQERAANKAAQDATALRPLYQFCMQSGLSGQSTVAEALARVRETEEMVSQARDRLDTLAREMRELEGIGLTAWRLAEDRDQLSSLGYALDAPGTEAVDRLIKQFNQELISFSSRLDTLTSERVELRRALDSIVGPSDEPNDYMHAVGLLREHIAITESVRTKIDKALQTFSWPVDGALAEIIAAAESLRQVASETQRAVARENQLIAARSELVERKRQLDEQLRTVGHRSTKFKQALEVLNDIGEHYSLNSAMESALQENRTSIETIFSQIHSPAEFVGLGGSIATLVRKGNGGVAALSEVSTGQRAAFGLSIFLAQNARLSNAPPVMLIDDPIAYVDDLNSLSFLDYLREIAIAGHRQIYFATANDKLATLFERKFDFLGQGFQRIELSRER